MKALNILIKKNQTNKTNLRTILDLDLDLEGLHVGTTRKKAITTTLAVNLKRQKKKP